MRDPGDHQAPSSAGGFPGVTTAGGGLGPRILRAADWLWTPRRRTRTLLLFGVLAAVVAGFYLWAKLPPGEELPLQGHRELDMNASVLLMEQEGAPPLLRRTPEGTVEAANLSPPSYDSILNGGDDTGVYVYGPVLADWLGISAQEALKILLLLFLVPILYYPLAFYRLTGSALAALAAPVLLVITVIQHALYFDVYWVQAWAILALLPLIPLARQLQGRWGWAISAFVMLGAAFTSTLRESAGIGIAVVALAVMAFAFTDWSWLRRAGGIGALIAVYLAISPGAMTLIENNSLEWAGDDLYERPAEGGNALFHIAYIGLGYQPNDWSIYYRDDIANAFAKREDPDVKYLSAEYDAILRHLFFDRVSEDPGFFAALLGKKLAVSLVAIGLSTLVFVLLATRLMLVAGPDRRLMRMALLIALPSIALGLAPGLLGIPQPQYVFGLTGAFAFLEIMIWALVLTVVGRWAAPRARRVLSSAGTVPGADEAALAAFAAAAVLAVVDLDLLRWAGVALLAGAAVLSLLASSRLRDRRIVDLSRRSVGVGAAVATLVVVAAALPMRAVSNSAVDAFFAWDTDLEAIEQTVSSTLPPSEPDVKVPPAS